MRYILLIICVVASARVTAQSDLKTENIFIITLDGLRWQELFSGADSALIRNKEYTHDQKELLERFWVSDATDRRKKLMPFFWSTLEKEGQLYGNRQYSNYVNCSNKMWFSYPGYNEILCGFADDERINSNNKIDNPNTTVLEFLNKQQKYSGNVAAFASWDVIPYIVNERRSGIPVNGGYETASGKNLTEREVFLNELQPRIPGPWGSVRLDAFTHYYAFEYVKKHKPRVVYISYGETDDFAHDGRYDEYLKAAHRTDQFIQEFWNWVQSQSFYKNKTTFLITTDHGRGTVPLETWRNHGDEISGADQIWFAVLGPDTPASGEQKENIQIYQNQVAKTAAAFLGVPYANTRPVGEVIKSAFKSNPKTRK